MPNYNPSTRERIGNIHDGLLVQTTAELAYTAWGVTVQTTLFTVYNRIIIHHLFLEVGETALVGAGALLQFNFASTVPVVAAAPLCAVCTDIDGFDRGRRVSFPGTTIATAASVDSTQGISLGPTMTAIVGYKPSAAGVTSVGQVGVLTTTAVLTAGTGQFSMLYTPFDINAYAVAAL